jgi:hypothetical protein
VAAVAAARATRIFMTNRSPSAGNRARRPQLDPLGLAARSIGSDGVVPAISPPPRTDYTLRLGRAAHLAGRLLSHHHPLPRHHPPAPPRTATALHCPLIASCPATATAAATAATAATAAGPSLQSQEPAESGAGACELVLACECVRGAVQAGVGTSTILSSRSAVHALAICRLGDGGTVSPYRRDDKGAGATRASEGACLPLPPPAEGRLAAPVTLKSNANESGAAPRAS